MSRTLIGLVAVALLGSVPAVTEAMTVSLVPGPGIYNAIKPGEIISFDVVIDFSRFPTVGGGIDITWDPTVLEFAGWDFGSSNIADDPLLRQVGNAAIPGAYSGLSVGDATSGLTAGTIGTISLLSTHRGDTAIHIGEAVNVPNPWIAFGTPWVQHPDYYGSDAGVIPLPASVLLIASGLMALLCFRRWT